jgi:glycosyltransferase involved in cell wall biosynthesis
VLEERAEAAIPGRARFLGWVEDLPTLYEALDLVVLTSRNEGTPISLIEAGAAGRAVVATRVGGVADVIQDGRTGLLVAPRDPDASAAAIEGLLGDVGRREEMGTRAREYVRERFSAEALVDHLADLYDELLSTVKDRR